MGIKQALDALVIIEESIFIPEDVRLSIEGLTVEDAKIKKAYRTIPKESDSINDPPAILNIWSASEVLRSSGLLETIYNINMQLFILDTGQDRAADIANAFWDAINAKFDTVVGMTLNGAISHSNLSGASPTLVGWNKFGGPFIGLNMYLEIFIKQVSNR